MYRYIFTSSLQRRRSAQSYPYNFLLAVQKKLKVGQIPSRTTRSNMKHIKIKLNDSTENKPNQYCIQTTKFILQASRPIIGSQDSLTRINIEINMQFILLIPPFQLIIKNTQSNFPINWKRPKLANALNALRERIAKRVDLIRRFERSPIKLMPTEESTKVDNKKNLTKISRGRYWNKQLSVVDETHCKSLIDLLRLREKTLVDRTITLIFWFEVQMERLKSENLLMHISEIRKKQESLLLNMYKERQYINRLLLRYKQNGHRFPIENEMLCLQSYNGDKFSLFPHDVRKEQRINFLSNTNYWQYNVLQSNLMDRSVGNIEFYNLCLWLKKRKIHKESIQRTIFPQNNDSFNYCEAEKDNAVESESQKLEIPKCDSEEGGKTDVAVGSFSSHNTHKTINNSMETEKSSEIRCNVIDVIPPCQNVKTQDKLCEIPNPPQTPLVARIKGLPIANQLNVSQKLPCNLNKEENFNIERLSEDISFELIQERTKRLGQDDSMNILSSSRWLRCGQSNIFNISPNFLSKRLESCSKSYTQGKPDHIEKVIIYELYNEDVHWENIYAITGDVLEKLTDELIMQHVKHVAKCIISR
ncbi:uncharacterized protein LOC117784332 [Drosophila innubila]|uniref:uncharacterized protein LOC117784332 n=1 Tax=Drosophila innubila TaxID=198719 RepID=UPI00148E1CF8|nr:uncharacterized protein LOC117784332 [Drosophila innubila]